jgi:hypothetical protein
MIQLHPRMRLLLPSLSLLAVSAVLAQVFAGPPVRAATSQEPHEGNKGKRDQDEDETKLGHAMEGLRSNAKAVAKALEAKDAEAAWKAVCGMQAKLLEAKQEEPATAAGKSAAERPVFVHAFRAKVSEALKKTCDLEAAVLAGKNEEAAGILREITGPMQKAGHQAFRKD